MSFRVFLAIIAAGFVIGFATLPFSRAIWPDPEPEHISRISFASERDDPDGRSGGGTTIPAQAASTAAE